MSKRSRDEVDEIEGDVEQSQDEIEDGDEELEEDSHDGDEEQQQQQQQQQLQQQKGELLASPPGFSPPGMSLRSGRKKRRRSKSTSGLTPTEAGTKPKQKLRASLGADGKVETDEPMKDATAQEGAADEDMEDVHGETEEDGKEDNDDDVDVAMSAVDNGDAKQSEKTTAPATSSTAEMNITKEDGNNNSNNTRDQPVLKLRMPSQHTPATRARAKEGATTTSTSATFAVAATLDAVNVSAVSTASGTTSNTISTRRLVFDTPPTDAATLLPNQQPPLKSGVVDDKHNGGTTTSSGDDNNIYLASATTTKPSPSSECDGHVNPVTRSLFRTGSDILVNFTSAIPEVLTNLVVPEPERLNSTIGGGGGGDDDGDAVVVDENKAQTHILGRTDVWMGILLVVYLLMSLTLGGGLPTNNVLAASEQTLTMYQQMLGMTPVPAASIVDEDLITPLQQEKETNNTTPKPKKIKVVTKKVQKTVQKVVEVPKIVKVPKVVKRKKEKTVKPPPTKSVKPQTKKQKQVFVEDETPSPLQPIINAMNTANSTMMKNFDKNTEEIQKVRKQIVKEWANTKQWEKSLKETRHILEALVQNSEGGNDQILLSKISHAKRTLETTRTLSNLPIIRIFDEDVSLWKIPEPIVCPDTPELPPPPPTDVVRSQMLFDTTRDVYQRIEESTKAIKANEDLVKKWIKESVSDLMPRLDLTDLEEIGSHHDELDDTRDDSADVNDVLRLTKKKLYDLIDKRLEVERADRTGRIDYASLQAGARVIQSGARSTSPSLVDNLPLFNRIMAYWRLRFYGHGPEAALTPTFPKNALGQCWSFENNASSKYKHWRNSHKLDQSNGKYATLTIRLPRPVQVSSIIIEHPPKETTKQVKSAIKNFRVVGYEDNMANGKSWPLGEFRYGINEMRSMQEFDVNTEDADGSTIPMLQSITLAIDSNYDFPYACLYRFRVHGEGELMIDDPEYE